MSCCSKQAVAVLNNNSMFNSSTNHLSLAQLESAISKHNHVNETAVVGVHDEIKGQALCCFVTLKSNMPKYPDLESEIRYEVRTRVGSFAVPQIIVITPGLCKTRSGKIMRRMLQKVCMYHFLPVIMIDEWCGGCPKRTHILSNLHRLLKENVKHLGTLPPLWTQALLIYLLNVLTKP